MKRQILFRAKTLNEGKWVQSMTIANGTIERKKHNLYMEVGNDKWKGVDPDTLGQYTGVEDINGKRIFEGDILRHQNGVGHICEIEWNKDVSAFCIRYSFENKAGVRPLGLWIAEGDKFEIIGNIYDHSELLDEKNSQ